MWFVLRANLPLTAENWFPTICLAKKAAILLLLLLLLLISWDVFGQPLDDPMLPKV